MNLCLLGPCCSKRYCSFSRNLLNILNSTNRNCVYLELSVNSLNSEYSTKAMIHKLGSMPPPLPGIRPRDRCPASDIWWWSLKIYSNLFSWGAAPLPGSGGNWNWSMYGFQSCFVVTEFNEFNEATKVNSIAFFCFTQETKDRKYVNREHILWKQPWEALNGNSARDFQEITTKVKIGDLFTLSRAD